MVETRGQAKRGESTAPLGSTATHPPLPPDSVTAASSPAVSSALPPAEPETPGQAGDFADASLLSGSPLTAYDYDTSFFRDEPLASLQQPVSSGTKATGSNPKGGGEQPKSGDMAMDDIMKRAQERVACTTDTFRLFERLNEELTTSKNNGVILQYDGNGGTMEWLIPFLEDARGGEFYPVPPEDMRSVMEHHEIQAPICWHDDVTELFIPVKAGSAACGCKSFKCRKSKDNCGYFDKNGVCGIRRCIFDHGGPSSPSRFSTPARSNMDSVLSRDLTPSGTLNAFTPSRSVPSPFGWTPSCATTSPVKSESKAKLGAKQDAQAMGLLAQFRVRQILQNSGSSQATNQGSSSSLKPPPSTQPKTKVDMETIDLTNMTDSSSESEDERMPAPLSPLFVFPSLILLSTALRIGTKRLWNPKSPASPRPIKRLNRGPQEETTYVSDRFEQYLEELPQLDSPEGMDLPHFNTFVNRVARCKHCSIHISGVALICHHNKVEELQNTDPDLEALIGLIEHSDFQGDDGDSRPVKRARTEKEEEAYTEGAARAPKKQRVEKRKPQKEQEMADANENRQGPREEKAMTIPEPKEWSPRELEPGEIPTPFFNFSSVPKGLPRNERKQLRDKVRRRGRTEAKLGMEIATANNSFQDVSVDSRIASTGWMGRNARADVRREIRELIRQGRKIEGLQIIPYSGQRTLVRDGNHRVFLVRSEVTTWMLHTLLPWVMEAAERFMKEVVWPSEEEFQENLRGFHFSCIAGYDRNNKSKPALSEWHPKNIKTLDSFFETGEPLEILTGYGCEFLQSGFPEIADRYKSCADEMERLYGIRPPYGGLFWNFCLNGVRSNGVEVPRVFCDPHVDFKNLALAEAGIALELPMGVFVLYPSSLFLHFNVDITNLKIVVTEDGSRLTPVNSKPLNCLCGKPKDAHNKDWRDSRGRGSMVWFNQATMFQTTELGFETVQQAKDAGAKATCDVGQWMEKNVFPTAALD
ncbi:hypothetical protein AAF712_015557 [Marasmius tenuissimus]|uniref:C3H1-type domain-containing protein n=1 Tax=Marasmius tenuissimus TaxID=585030 RepID=A0ABR2Z870_9AGAR